MLQPPPRRTLPDVLFEQLSSEILGGAWRPGAPIPPERELCQSLGVNRGAIREAIQRLAQARLVSIRHGDGVRVCDYRHSASLDLLPRLLVRPGGGVDLAVLRSVLELRACVGTDAAGLCAERCPDATTAALGELVGQMRAAQGAPRALQDLALALWDAIVDGSANLAYRLAFNALRQSYEHVMDAVTVAVAPEVGDVDAHEAIVRAIAARDPRAARDAARALLTAHVGALLAFAGPFAAPAEPGQVDPPAATTRRSP